MVVVHVDGEVSSADVTHVTQSLAQPGGMATSQVAVLAIVSGPVVRPGDEAKRAMRQSRATLRECAGVHIVLPSRGLPKLGLLGVATRLLMGGRPPVRFYADEGAARAALRAEGFLS